MMAYYRGAKPRDLRRMSSEDLKKMIQDISSTQIRLLGFSKSGGGINPGQWRNLKKQKAKILTILGERKRLGE